MIYILLVLILIPINVYSLDSTMEVSTEALQREETRYKRLMQNVTNLKTPGYREVNDYQQESKKITVKNYYNFTQGQMEYTGRRLDLAIEGRGFFVVQKKNRVFYTRDGRFVVDKNNMLRTLSGDMLVIGENGPIEFDETEYKLQITDTGKIIQEENVVARFLVADFYDLMSLNRLTGSFFYVSDPNVIPLYLEDYSLKVGYLEGSNVNLSKQLVSIPEIEKMHDVNSKVIQLRLKSMTSSLELGKPQ